MKTLAVLAVAGLALGGAACTEDTSPRRTIVTPSAVQPSAPPKTLPPTVDCPGVMVEVLPEEFATTFEPVPFEPTDLAADNEYTSVEVTLINSSKAYLVLGAATWTLSDGSVLHQSTTGIGMHKRQMKTTIVAPGEQIVGIVTARGDFTVDEVEATGCPFAQKPKKLPKLPSIPTQLPATLPPLSG